MADYRAHVPTPSPVTPVIPTVQLIEIFLYVSVTIFTVSVLKRLIVSGWYGALYLGNWCKRKFGKNRTDDLEELRGSENSSETSGNIDTEVQKYDKNVKDYEEILKRIVEGKDNWENSEREEEDLTRRWKKFGSKGSPSPEKLVIQAETHENQFEEALSQISPVPVASQKFSKAPEVPPKAPEALDAPEAPEEIEIKNMDLLNDQFSYYSPAHEAEEFEIPDPVFVEPVGSMTLKPGNSAPRGESPRNGFEVFTHNTVVQERENSYQLSENESQLIEENRKFFESGQDQVESPQEINQIMMWSRLMSESCITPNYHSMVEIAGSPEVENIGNVGPPINDSESVVGEFEQFEEDDILEAGKHEKDVK